VVTVWSLVLRTRMLGWSREYATTSLVTGLVLLPFGRLLSVRRSRARGLSWVSHFPCSAHCGGLYDATQGQFPPS
jgi:hypothetical protein